MENGKILQYLESMGYHTPAGGYAAHIREYLAWYRGYVSEFHDYAMRVGAARRTLTRYHLGMAKTVCEDFATLLLNEKVQIGAEGFPALPAILEKNAFMERANRLVEWTMALGTGALVEFLDAEGRPTIDYIRGDLIFPLRWDGDHITECAFGSRRVLGGGRDAVEGYYVQIHAREPGGYVIRNVYLDDAGAELFGLTPGRFALGRDREAFVGPALLGLLAGGDPQVRHGGSRSLGRVDEAGCRIVGNGGHRGLTLTRFDPRAPTVGGRGVDRESSR